MFEAVALTCIGSDAPGEAIVLAEVSIRFRVCQRQYDAGSLPTRPRRQVRSLRHSGILADVMAPSAELARLQPPMGSTVARSPAHEVRGIR